jgi:hypothetical protein
MCADLGRAISTVAMTATMTPTFDVWKEKTKDEVYNKTSPL